MVSTSSAVQAAVPPLSQSRQALMACPHLYVERIVLGKREAPNPYAQRGQIIHKILATYVDHLVRTRQGTDVEMYDRLLIGLDQEALEVLQPMRDSFAVDPERVVGTELYLALDEALQPMDANYAATRPGEAWLPAYEGTPDLVFAHDVETAEIWDWKSYYQIIEADTFQAELYPLLVFLHFPQLQHIRFRLEFVRYGAHRVAEYSRADVPRLKKKAKAERERQRALHGSIEAPTLAMPGSHCCWCPKLLPSLELQNGRTVAAENVCPIAAINPYTQQSPEDRVRFAVWLSAARKENDRVLKDHVNAQGPIDVADGNGQQYRASFALKERTKFPLKAALPVLNTWAANGEALHERLYIGATELKPLLKAKKRAALAEELAGVAVKIPQTRFGVSGVEDEEEEA
jgi:hypothetical protein